MGTRLINTKTGKPEDLQDADVPNAVASGSFAFPEGAKVPVLDLDGNPVEISGADAGRAFKDAGFRFLGEAGVRERELQTKYGEGLGPALQAGAEGFASGLTAGASDVLNPDKEGVRERAERNPIPSGVGKVAGVVVPALATGGLSAEAQAARGLATGARALEGAAAAGEVAGAGRGLAGLAEALGVTPAGVISRVGGAAERGVSEALGSSLAGKVAGSAVRGAAENATFQVGDNLSEAALHDKPLVGDQLLAHVGPAALLGSGGNAVLEGSLGLASKYLPRAARAATSALEEVEGRLEKVAAGMSPKAEPLGKGLQKALEDTRGAVEHLVAVDKPARLQQLLGDADQAGQVALQLVDQVDDMLPGLKLDVMVIGDAQGVTTRLSKQLEAASTDAERMTLLEQGVRRLERVGAGEAAQPWRAALGDEALFGRGAVYHRELEGRLGELQAARAQLEEAVGNGKGGLSKERLGQYLLGQGKAVEGAPDPVRGFVQAARDLFDHAETSTWSEMTTRPTGSRGISGLLDSLQEQAGDAGRAAKAAHAAGEGVHGVGPTELLAMGAHAAGVHVAAPIYTAMKVVELAAHPGRAVEVLHRVVARSREVGEQFGRAVDLLVKGGKDLGLRTAPVSAGLLASVRLLPREGKSEPAPRGMEGRKREALRVAQEAAQLAADPPALIKRATQVTAPLAKHAPSVATEMGNGLVRKVAYLARVAPKAPAGLDQWAQKRWVPSDAELARFERQIQAVEHPRSILADAASGRLTRDQVEAVREVYPRLYQDLQERTLKALATGKEPSYQRKLMLGLLLGQPLTTGERFQAQLQARLTALPGGQPSAGAAPSVSPGSLKVAERTGTKLQKGTS